MPKEQSKNEVLISRPPVIVVTGHIDHGKSTLLDFIRKTNIVEGEAGGITQHISAYEVIHKREDGKEQKITFLDTPGHQAFSGMRERGVEMADIAILIVSAEDSVKAQTIESLKTIKASGLPFIVAINKIDKPGANIEKTKNDLVEHEVYIEGYGGDIPYVPISAKSGEGIPELLDIILLVADMAELKGDPKSPASGAVLESRLDQKCGITTTLVVKNGTLRKGMFVVSEESISPVRAIADFLGHAVDSISFSSPVSIVGFNKIPSPGAPFTSYETKKEAEEAVRVFLENKNLKKQSPTAKNQTPETEEVEAKKAVFPIVLKSDTLGTLEAIERELLQLSQDLIEVKITQKGVGSINESDVKMAGATAGGAVIGFNVKTDTTGGEIAMRNNVPVKIFNIIYKLTEWVSEELEKQKPRTESEEITGEAKILKVFSSTKNKQVAGGRVLTGTLISGSNIIIKRRDIEIGRGKIIELQQQKLKTKEVEEGLEFGLLIESKIDVAPGDTIASFMIVQK
jgi:translation initiation factor IF-2